MKILASGSLIALLIALPALATFIEPGGGGFSEGQPGSGGASTAVAKRGHTGLNATTVFQAEEGCWAPDLSFSGTGQGVPTSASLTVPVANNVTVKANCEVGPGAHAYTVPAGTSIRLLSLEMMTFSAPLSDQNSCEFTVGVKRAGEPYAEALGSTVVAPVLGNPATTTEPAGTRNWTNLGGADGLVLNEGDWLSFRGYRAGSTPLCLTLPTDGMLASLEYTESQGGVPPIPGNRPQKNLVMIGSSNSVGIMDGDYTFSYLRYLRERVGENWNVHTRGCGAMSIRNWSSVAAFTDTVTLTSGSATASMVDTSNVVPGMLVTGTGIPADTVVFTVDSSTQITLARDATASGAQSITFTGSDGICSNYDFAPETLYTQRLQRQLRYAGAGTVVGIWVGINEAGSSPTRVGPMEPDGYEVFMRSTIAAIQADCAACKVLLTKPYVTAGSPQSARDRVLGYGTRIDTIAGDTEGVFVGPDLQALLGATIATIHPNEAQSQLIGEAIGDAILSQGL